MSARDQGGLPTAHLLDNGRAYASKRITGGADCKFRFKAKPDERDARPQPLDKLVAAIEAVKAAFGAPGDHGYETREGRALFQLYGAMGEISTVRVYLTRYAGSAGAADELLSQALLSLLATLENDIAGVCELEAVGDDEPVPLIETIDPDCQECLGEDADLILAIEEHLGGSPWSRPDWLDAYLRSRTDVLETRP